MNEYDVKSYGPIGGETTICSLFAPAWNKHMKFTGWMTDPEVWKAYTNDDAIFAIGAPTVELFAESYNSTGKDNTITLGVGGLGYTVKDTSGLLLSTYNGGIYNKNGGWWWLSSPGSYTGSSFGRCLYVLGNSKGLSSQDVMSSIAVRPVVCIQTSVFSDNYTLRSM